MQFGTGSGYLEERPLPVQPEEFALLPLSHFGEVEWLQLIVCARW